MFIVLWFLGVPVWLLVCPYSSNCQRAGHGSPISVGRSVHVMHGRCIRGQCRAFTAKSHIDCLGPFGSRRNHLRSKLHLWSFRGFFPWAGARSNAHEPMALAAIIPFIMICRCQRCCWKNPAPAGDLSHDCSEAWTSSVVVSDRWSPKHMPIYALASGPPADRTDASTTSDPATQNWEHIIHVCFIHFSPTRQGASHFYLLRFHLIQPIEITWLSLLSLKFELVLLA